MRSSALPTLLFTLVATACTGSESSVPVEAEKTTSYWSYQLKDEPESRIEVTILEELEYEIDDSTIEVQVTSTDEGSVGRVKMNPIIVRGGRLEMVEEELHWQGESLGELPRPAKIRIDTSGITVNEELLVPFDQPAAPEQG